MPKYLLTVACIFFIVSQASSQDLNTAKLDTFFNVLSEHNKIMGSFAIAKKGKVVYERSIGYANGNIPATKNTLYHIGSVTKMFTATMIFQLIDEGRLSLNSTLDKWFPVIPNSRQITIKMLLDHRSGLFDFVNDDTDTSWLTKPHTKDELLKKIISGKTHFLPGTGFSYSNSGYLLLAYIIETITKHSYNDNLQMRICKRIGLKNTYSPPNNTLKKNEADPYVFGTKWEKITDIYFPNVTGVGNILSTTTDLIKFDSMLLGGKLISASNLKLMKTVQDGIFGTGMLIVPSDDSHTGYGFAGDTYGTHTLVLSFSDDQLIVSYCINGEAYPHEDVTTGILNICFNQQYQIPVYIYIPNEILANYVGIYSSTQFLLKFTVTNLKGILTAQATGQSSFTLEAIKKNEFKQSEAGIIMSFDSDKNEMTFKQGSKTFLFKKE